jgi:hypothetical protein
MSELAKKRVRTSLKAIAQFKRACILSSSLSERCNHVRKMLVGRQYDNLFIVDLAFIKIHNYMTVYTNVRYSHGRMSSFVHGYSTHTRSAWWANQSSVHLLYDHLARGSMTVKITCTHYKKYVQFTHVKFLGGSINLKNLPKEPMSHYWPRLFSLALSVHTKTPNIPR